MQSYTLNTGASVPAIGFGTWQLSDQEARAMVLEALETGYRLIDTARIYGNEAAVGQAIRESGIDRKEIFVTTKLWNEDQGYDSALKACHKSLDQLGLDYLDLYLIHWPATSRRHEAWRAFEQLSSEGVIKAAGVSNYTVDHLEQLLERSELVPAVNQIEFHPYIYGDQRAVLEFCHDKAIFVEAYSPLRRLSSSDTEAIDQIAERLGVSPQQVVLRWCIQQQTIPLPRSSSADHVRSNFDVFSFELTDQDVDILSSISDGERVTWDPQGMGGRQNG
jgi:diketogulonate reductase-like aldo/keto reductase